MSTSPLRWFKSSYCDDGGGDNCVEVASCPEAIHVWDSKNPGPVLTLTPATWVGFADWAAEA
jgi:hypothetical protein